MVEQIECVGGPWDGRRIVQCGIIIKAGQESFKADGTEITHRYHYDPQSNKYVYKGVEG